MTKETPPAQHASQKDSRVAPPSSQTAGGSAEAAQHREEASEIGDRVGLTDDEAPADPAASG